MISSGGADPPRPERPRRPASMAIPADLAVPRRRPLVSSGSALAPLAGTVHDCSATGGDLEKDVPSRDRDGRVHVAAIASGRQPLLPPNNVAPQGRPNSLQARHAEERGPIRSSARPGSPAHRSKSRGSECTSPSRPDVDAISTRWSRRHLEVRHTDADQPRTWSRRSRGAMSQSPRSTNASDSNDQYRCEHRRRSHPAIEGRPPCLR